MQPQHFQFELDEHGVGTITLSRPERLNALTFESYAELRDFFVHLRGRDDVRSVCLTATGRAFCSGGDVKDIIGELFDVGDDKLFAFTRMTCDLIHNIRLLEKPVVAGLNGITCGAGAVMAAAADLRVASTSAKIAFLFVKVGLSGADMGASWLLPRIVGQGLAAELLMGGEFISPERAERIGLYNQVVSDEELPKAAYEWAKKLADGPVYSHAVTKRLLNAEASMTLAQGMSAEGWIQAECMKHPDYREGFDAAMEKRAPDFRASQAKWLESRKNG